MKRHYTLLLIVLFSGISYKASAQDYDDEFNQYTTKPKDTLHILPIDYKIVRPQLQVPNWDKDYNAYEKLLTPAIEKTQASVDFVYQGVKVAVWENAAMTHTQLDTTTAVQDSTKILGTWRMLKHRVLKCIDSVAISSATYYRLPDSVLHDYSKDEAFAIITHNKIKLYAKPGKNTQYYKVFGARYTRENNRTLLLYKLSKAAGMVAQYGIDENGFLLLNWYKVIEHQKKDAYIAYYSLVEQYIFQQVKLGR